MLCVIRVSRQQLQQRLMNVKSPAESMEIVDKLRAVEQQILALVSSDDSQQQRAGMLTVWTFSML